MNRKRRPCELLIDELRARVSAAAPGEALGTEVAIAQESGYSRMTVRKAVNVLVEERLVERRAGVGVFASKGRRALRFAFLAGNMLWDVALKVASGFRQEALAAGAQVELFDAGGDSQKLLDRIAELPGLGLDGAVVLSTHDDVLAAALSGISSDGFPVVVVDQVVDGVPSVVSDNRLGGAMAAERILHAGHVATAFVGDFAADTVAARWEGFRAICESATGAAPQKCGVGGRERLGDWEGEVRAAVGRLMRGRKLPTAIFCSCDAIARHAMRVLAECGLSVPRDVSLVGFDDDPIAEWTAPALTTVRQDFGAMGREAHWLLAARIADPSAPCAVATVPVEFVERESLAKPRTVRTR